MRIVGSITLALVLGLALPAATHAATVTCTDGTTAKSGRGACSHHGGVAATATTPPKAASDKGPAKPPQSAADVSSAATGATARCKDNTYSHAAHRSGACSKHGGVAEWMK